MKSGKLLIVLLSFALVGFAGALTIPTADAQPGDYDIFTVMYSPDGTRFAVGGSLNEFKGVIVFSTDGQELFRLDIKGIVNGLSWNPDGTHLAVRYAPVSGLSIGDPILIYDLTTQTEPLLLDSQTAANATAMPWSSDGKMLVNYSGPWLTVWDTTSGEPISTISVGSTGRQSIEDVAWHPQTNELYILSASNNLFVFDPISGEQTQEPISLNVRESDSSHYWFSSAMALNPDGSRIAIAFNDDFQTMEIRGADAGDSAAEPVTRFNASAPDFDVRVLRWMPSGKEIATLGTPSLAVSFWDVETGVLTRRYSDFGIDFPRTFAISPDGTQMIVVGVPYNALEATAEVVPARAEYKTLIPRVAVLVDLTADD